MTKAPHKGNIAPGRYPDELIHMDTVGPLRPAKDGSTYFIHFHCDKTKEVECYTMKYKSEALAKFKLFQASRRGRDKEEPNAVGRRRTKLDDLHPDWRIAELVR